MNTEEIKAILAPLIKLELLNQAYAAGATDEDIFTQQLYSAMVQLPPLLIKYSWQLELLDSKLKDMEGFKDWEQRDNNGATPVHYAAWSGNLDLMQWVLTQDKEALTRKDNYSRTVVLYAAWSGNQDLMQWVLNQDKEALTRTDGYGRTVVHYAAWSGNLSLMQWVLPQDKDVLTRPDREGCTVMHYAALSGNLDLMNWLLTQDKDALTRKDGYGCTVADYAAQSGNPDLMKWLLIQDKGVLTRKDDNGLTVVHYAAFSRNPKQPNKVFQLTNADKFYGNLLERYSEEIENIIFTTLEKALAINFVVTEVSYPSDVKEETREGIDALLMRNKLLMAGLNSIQQPVVSGTFFAKSTPGQSALYERAVNLKQRAYSLESDAEKQEVFEEILELSGTYWAKKLQLTPDILDSPVDILKNCLGQFGEEVNSSPTPQKNAIKTILAEAERAQCEDNWEEVLRIIEHKNAGTSSVPDSIIEYFKYRAILAIPGNLPEYTLPGPMGSINSDP